MNEGTVKPYNKKIGIICFVVFLVLVAWIVQSFRPTELQQKPLPQIHSASSPQIHAASALQKYVFTKGEKIVININANTQGKPLTGFDVVLRFDPKIVQFKETTGQHSSFDTFVTNGKGIVSVTGALKMKSTAVAVSDSQLISTIFTTITEGDPKFSIDYLPGKRSDSNLIDDKSQDILRSVSIDEFTVGSSLKLFRGKTVMIDESLLATLQSATIADSQCADCTNDATVDYAVDGKTYIVKYVEGGIDGQTGRSDMIGDYLIELQSIHDGYIMVGVYKAK